MSLGTLHLALSYSSLGAIFSEHFLYGIPEWFDRYPSLIWFFRVTYRDVLESWILWCGFRVILKHHFLLGLESLCSSVGLSKSMFPWCPCGGLFGSSVEFTSFHSLFTLSFHSSVHIPYICKLYRRGAYL